MSVNMDTIDMQSDEVDYSDFTHEQVHATHVFDGSNNFAKFSVDPLEEKGGLRPNQVAELVAFYAIVSLGPESGANDSPEARGVFGFDMDESNSLPDAATGEGTVKGLGGSTADANARIDSNSDAGVIWQFGTHGDDMTREITYRADDYTGRGPVVDPDDSFDIVSTGINNSASTIDLQYYVQLVWDIYEVDDARSEFALPGGD